MKYLTEEGRSLLQKQIIMARTELDHLSGVRPCTGLYRMQQRYIHGLQFLLEMEYEE